MTIAKTFKILDDFRGKKNAVVTILIPPNTDIITSVVTIMKQVSVIKNTEKRLQLLVVLQKIVYNPSNKPGTRSSNNGKIICAGLTEQNCVFYYELNPPNKIHKFEYFYDFFFYMDKVREVWYQDVIFILNGNEQKTVVNNIDKLVATKDSTLIYSQQKIDYAIHTSTLKELYIFSEKQLSDDVILKLQEDGGHIVKIVDDKLKQKYGEQIGKIWFVVDESDGSEDIEDLVDIPLE